VILIGFIDHNVFVQQYGAVLCVAVVAVGAIGGFLRDRRRGARR